LLHQIDVHYSLPRDDHSRSGDKEKNQVYFGAELNVFTFTQNVFANLKQLQGTLLVTLRNSASGQPIDDNEVRRKFQQFGDVKSVKPVNDRPECVSTNHYLHPYI
jgi:hypothetical protein